MWSFPSLAEPSVFVAAPGDLAALRDVAAEVLDELQRSVDHGVRLYDWQEEKAEDGFRDWVPPQGQIPLPSDPNCRAVICLFGERIGTPMPVDFDTGPLGPLDAWRGERAGLVHAWRPGAEAEGGFALTGTVFEYLAALHANRRAENRSTDPSGDASRGQPPILLLILADREDAAERLKGDAPAIDAGWGGKRLLEAAQRRFTGAETGGGFTALLQWIETEYRPQVTQLRNLLRLLEQLGIFPRIVTGEDAAREEIRAFLVRELALQADGASTDPFKGLAAYDREDAGVFVGREPERKRAIGELTALWDDAARPTFYGVTGGSGVGKSSFARAGIVGHLCRQKARGSAYLACIVRPDDLLPDPLPRLHALAMREIDPALSFDGERESLARVRDEAEPEESVRRLAAALARRGSGSRLLLAFDQFEELLDLRLDEGGERLWGQVVAFIARAAREPALGVVYTLQTNRESLLAEDPLLGPLAKQGRSLSLSFPLQSLDEIIRTPFTKAGITELEPELVAELRDRILAFAGRSDGRAAGSLLPLVSLTLRRIFEAHTLGERAAQGDAPPEAPDGRRRLGLADCEGLLEIEGAIAGLASAAVEDARSAAGAAWSEDSIASLLRRLVRLSTAEDDRLLLPEAPMPSAPGARRLAQALLDRRLLLPESGGRIRLVHEAVVRHWPAAARALESQRHLMRLAGILDFSAQAWEAGGRQDSGLASRSERDVDDAAMLLAHWFDTLGGEAAGEDSQPGRSDQRLRDYALALMRVHPMPRRVVESTPSGSSHLIVAAFYGDMPLLSAMLATDPQAVREPRRDGRTALFAPCVTGRADVLEALVEAGADPDHADAEGWRPLHLAASTGRLDALDALLRAGASLAKAGDGQVASPLYLAAANGHAAVVRRLLALGMDPARTLDGGWTALHAAASEGHAEVVAALAEGGAPLETALPESACTALHLATLSGHADAVRALAAAGADAAATAVHDRRKETTALHLAVLRDRHDCARALLAAGAPANARDDLEQTPLYLALSTGRSTMANTLLAGGADIDAPARDGRSCLALAVARPDEGQVRYLLARGADPDVADGRGLRAVHIAASAGQVALLRLLLEAGADAGARDGAGRTPLHHAARCGHAALVELLTTGMPVDPMDDDGLTPLHLAAEAGHAALAEQLLGRGARVDARDADGWTPLHLAVLSGHAAGAQRLLEAGAPVDVESDRPRTRPLHVAAELGHASLVGLLLQAGADPEAASRDKPSPLQSALRFRQADAARALRAAGARVDPEDAETLAGLIGERPAPGPIVDATAATAPGGALRGLFNARGAEAATPQDATAAEDPEARQARLHTGRAGVADYRWRPADEGLRALVTARGPFGAGGRVFDPASTTIETTGLAWYDAAVLVRVRDPSWQPSGLTLYFVRSSAGELVRLAGTSTPIHDLNAAEPIRLQASNVLGYLKFFCFFVRGEEGAFYVLERADDPLVPPAIPATLQAVLRETVRPAAYEGLDEEGRFACSAVIWYSNALFISDFRIDAAGGIEMPSDEPIAADLPIRADAPIDPAAGTDGSR